MLLSLFSVFRFYFPNLSPSINTDTLAHSCPVNFGAGQILTFKQFIHSLLTSISFFLLTGNVGAPSMGHHHLETNLGSLNINSQRGSYQQYIK